MKLLRIFVVALVLLISPVASAEDIYVCTEETSQGGIWEYYVRTETIEKLHVSNNVDFQVSVFRIGKDKWNKGYPPMHLRYTFMKEGDGNWYYTEYNVTAHRQFIKEARRVPMSPKNASDTRNIMISKIFAICVTR